MQSRRYQLQAKSLRTRLKEKRQVHEAIVALWFLFVVLVFLYLNRGRLP